MSMNLWNPWDDMLSLREAMNRLLEDSYVRPVSGGTRGNLALDLILKKQYGRLVSIHKGFYDSVSITSVTSEKKVVDVPKYYNTERLRPIYDFDGAPLFIMTND